MGGDSNLYRYAGGNPVNFVDPDGHSPTLITAVAGAGVGAALGGGIAWMNGGNWQQGAIQGAIVGGVSGLTLGWGGAAIAGVFGGGALGGAAAGVVTSAAGNLAGQGYAILSKERCSVDWGSFATSVALGATGGGILLRPYTAVNHTITSWAPAGVSPDLNPGRWVMVGDSSARNWVLTGTGHPFGNSVTGIVSGSQLAYPTGWESIKGLLGQRLVR